jgi:hypothetical protein
VRATEEHGRGTTEEEEEEVESATACNSGENSGQFRFDISSGLGGISAELTLAQGDMIQVTILC